MVFRLVVNLFDQENFQLPTADGFRHASFDRLKNPYFAHSDCTSLQATIDYDSCFKLRVKYGRKFHEQGKCF